MKNVLAICYAIVLTSFVIGCERSEQAQQQEQDDTRQTVAEKVVKRIYYIKDSRTGICFAYFFWDKGPALATAPCDEIPPEMLKVTK